MFYSCENLQEVEGLKNLDTSNTVEMSGMFWYSGIKTVDLSGLDTSKVTGMRSMFEGCRNLESVNLSGLNTSSLSTAYNMFNATGNVKVKWGGFDLSGVDAFNMFYGSQIESVDWSDVKTSSTTNLYGAFCECDSLKTANMPNLKSSDFGYLFGFCDNLVDVNLSGAEFDSQSQSKSILYV